MSWRLVGPTFIAIAIIVSTIVARLVPETVPFVLAGPLLMAGSLLAVAVVDHRRFAGPQAIVGGALILGAAVVLAGALSARRDPASVAENMWLYGTAVGASMSLTLGRGCRRRSAEASELSAPGVSEPEGASPEVAGPAEHGPDPPR